VLRAPFVVPFRKYLTALEDDSGLTGEDAAHTGAPNEMGDGASRPSAPEWSDSEHPSRSVRQLKGRMKAAARHGAASLGGQRSRVAGFRRLPAALRGWRSFLEDCQAGALSQNRRSILVLAA
jgi:hypothetical protein